MKFHFYHHRQSFNLDMQAEIPDHGVMGIYGPSGAGKSTLLAMMAGLVTPDAGQFTLEGACLFDRVKAVSYTHLDVYKRQQGYGYGDFSGHNSLWEMAERTNEDVLARMALVPRTMEARGLDASVPLRNKFAQIGDTAVADILDIILRDEIGHVAIGNHWFNWLCAARQLSPIATFEQLCQQYKAPKPVSYTHLDVYKRQPLL